MSLKINVILHIGILITAFLFPYSCGKSNHDNDVNANISKDITEIRLPSIQCPTCKRHITEALENFQGIEEIEIDVADKIASVKFDKSKTDLSKIENAITALGYDANDKKADSVAYEKIEDCCKIANNEENK